MEYSMAHHELRQYRLGSAKRASSSQRSRVEEKVKIKKSTIEFSIVGGEENVTLVEMRKKNAEMHNHMLQSTISTFLSNNCRLCCYDRSN